MLKPEVILVNDNDEVIGFEDKLVAHQKGLKHRAISVLLFNNTGDWLMQKRAKEKYHSGGLWTNTCCSHPYPNENTQDSANRRLKEEMGMEANLSYAFNFSYNVNLDNNLIENELDHVYVGFTESIPILNPQEASDYRYCSTEFLEKDISNYPNKYTEWFKIIFDKVKVLDLKGIENDN